MQSPCLAPLRNVCCRFQHSMSLPPSLSLSQVTFSVEEQAVRKNTLYEIPRKHQLLNCYWNRWLCPGKVVYYIYATLLCIYICMFFIITYWGQGSLLSHVSRFDSDSCFTNKRTNKKWTQTVSYPVYNKVNVCKLLAGRLSTVLINFMIKLL